MLPTETQRLASEAERSKDRAPAVRSDIGSRTPGAHQWNDDTVEHCEARALADLLLAPNMETDNRRLLMERSAGSWAARAGVLAGEATEGHLALLQAEWVNGEEADRVADHHARNHQPDSENLR